MSDTNGDAPSDKTAVGIGVNLQVRPDGKTSWVGIQFMTPVSSAVFAFPPEAIDEIADNLPGALKDAAEKARQFTREHTTGLYIPGEGK